MKLYCKQGSIYIARYLEERRLEADGKLSSSDKKDNFILYETEHQKERYKRNR